MAEWNKYCFGLGQHSCNSEVVGSNPTTGEKLAILSKVRYLEHLLILATHFS